MELQTFYIIEYSLLTMFTICIIIMGKYMVVDSIRFSGTLEKGIYQGKQTLYIKTPFRKIPLSKMYNVDNPYTLMLQEREFYKNGTLDKDGGFIIPLWSLYQTHNGRIPDKEILELEQEEYVNYFIH